MIIIIVSYVCNVQPSNKVMNEIENYWPFENEIMAENVKRKNTELSAVYREKLRVIFP